MRRRPSPTVLAPQGCPESWSHVPAPPLSACRAPGTLNRSEGPDFLPSMSSVVWVQFRRDPGICSEIRLVLAFRGGLASCAVLLAMILQAAFPGRCCGERWGWEGLGQPESKCLWGWGDLLCTRHNLGGGADASVSRRSSTQPPSVAQS